jgi:hypothetical protein
VCACLVWRPQDPVHASALEPPPPMLTWRGAPVGLADAPSSLPSSSIPSSLPSSSSSELHHLQRRDSDAGPGLGPGPGGPWWPDQLQQQHAASTALQQMQQEQAARREQDW